MLDTDKSRHLAIIWLEQFLEFFKTDMENKNDGFAIQQLSENYDTEEEKKSTSSEVFKTKHFKRIIQDEDSVKTVEELKEPVLDTDDDPLTSDLTNRLFPELLQ